MATENDKTKDPVNPKSDNPSLNDRLHTATQVQSSVKPEDYPASERAGQTAVVGKDAGRQGKPKVSGA